MSKHVCEKTATMAAGFGAVLVSVTSMATAHAGHNAPAIGDMFVRSLAAAVQPRAAAQQEAAYLAAARRRAIQAAARRAARDGRARELRVAPG